MKKTRNKIFVTIFAILTVMVVGIFSVSFYQNYRMHQKIIERATGQMSRLEQTLERNHLPVPSEKFNPILIDVDSANELLRGIWWRTIILMMLAEIVAALVAWFLTKWIMRPVEESFARQKEFVADASHELKTPLAVIIASSETFERDHDAKWMKNIQNEAGRMEQLVKKMLDLSRSEQENLQLSQHNLSEIVERQILTLESLFYEKGIKLNYKIEDNIEWRCDPARMKELVGILLDNAIKHCDREGNVNVFLTKRGKSVVLKVENTGEAIAPEEEERIFERFYRSDKSRNRDGERYGLGLAIAKNIVEGHGGTIKAHSEKGITEFRVVL